MGIADEIFITIANAAASEITKEFLAKLKEESKNEYHTKFKKNTTNKLEILSLRQEFDQWFYKLSVADEEKRNEIISQNFKKILIVYYSYKNHYETKEGRGQRCNGVVDDDMREILRQNEDVIIRSLGSNGQDIFKQICQDVRDYAIESFNNDIKKQ